MWTPKLEQQFEAELRDMLRRSQDDASYVGTYFLQMLNERGGRATAETLLAKKDVGEGFVKLWPDHAHLTMEYVVASEPWKNLFTQSEVRTARERLGRMAPEC